MGKILDLNTTGGVKKTFQSKSYFTGNTDVGTLSDYGGTELDGTNATITQLKTALNEDNYNLSELVQSPNINHWALFKPLNQNSPYNLGDFMGYNHQAKEPTFFSDGSGNKITSKSISYEVGFTGVYDLYMQRGEMSPIESVNGGWNPQFIISEDISNNDLIKLRIEVNGTDKGVEKLYIDDFVSDKYTFTLSESGSTSTSKTIRGYYYTRNSIAHDWVKYKEIEHSGITLNITVTPYAITFSNLSISPSTHNYSHPNDYITISNVTFSFRATNNSASSVSRTIYWSLLNDATVRATGTISTGIINAGNYADLTQNTGSQTLYINTSTGTGTARFNFYSDSARTNLLNYTPDMTITNSFYP